MAVILKATLKKGHIEERAKLVEEDKKRKEKGKRSSKVMSSNSRIAYTLPDSLLSLHLIIRSHVYNLMFQSPIRTSLRPLNRVN